MPSGVVDNLRLRWSIQSCLDACLPPRCVLCAAAGQRRPTLDLCLDCERELPWLPDSAGLPLAAFQYAAPVDHLVQALKYQRRLALARVLGTLLARPARLRAALDGLEALVPMPLHPARAADRGFNQSWEIATWFGRAVDLPLAPQILRRTRHTAPQVGLDAPARQANVAGAFAASPACAGQRLLLLDDVVTSGATTGEAVRALLAQGAKEVRTLAVARA